MSRKEKKVKVKLTKEEKKAKRKVLRGRIGRFLRGLAMEIIGGTLVAIGIYNFAVNANFPVSGFSGISLILYKLFNIPIGLSTIVMNVPVALLQVNRKEVLFQFLKMYAGFLTHNRLPCAPPSHIQRGQAFGSNLLRRFLGAWIHAYLYAELLHRRNGFYYNGHKGLKAPHRNRSNHLYNRWFNYSHRWIPLLRY